ncbi:YbaN family protein [Aerococcaceae bacterium zg-ZJ1578]|uniref:YbaN family protein n=1 Tax=Aerococcaceae bacterium zg-252 TaxID=2796928 RepID=UPI001A26555C|nr:YbaN family protein [Aerococcaceae bacterium zg-1578]
MKKLIYFIFGSISLVIGTVAVYVPGIPTTIFYLAAAYCFGRSSDRLYRYVTGSKFYQEYVHEPFVKKSITQEKKRRVYLSLTIVFLIAILIVPKNWLKVMLAGIYLAHLLGLNWYWKR